MLKKLGILVSLLCLCEAAIQAPPDLGGRPAGVVGGSKASVSDFPFYVGLVVPTYKSPGLMDCGGSLITKTHVLTAKHCVSHPHAAGGSYAFFRGRSDEKNTREIKSIKTHTHEDLAVVELESAVTIGDGVQTISLASSEPSVGTYLSVMGEGALTGRQFRASQVPITYDRNCYMLLSPHVMPLPHIPNSYTNPKFICTGDPQAKSSNNACRGDSGGPLAYRKSGSDSWKLVGVTIRGHPQCAKDLAVSISVPHFKDWIEEAAGMKKKSSCFSGSSQVETPVGKKSMSELQVGDHVLTAMPTGQLQFSPVLMFLDRQSEAELEFVKVTTSHQDHALTLTPRHIIFRCASQENDFSRAESVFADKLRTGDCVFYGSSNVTALQTVTITAVCHVKGTGAHAPLTAEGTIVVDGLVASNYAHLEQHWLAHATMAPVRWLKGAVGWAPATPDGTHWYPSALETIFGAALLSY